MSKKLAGNGLWESSRMMLPEHREAILSSNRQLNKRTMPELHEDEWELYLRIISESFYTKKRIKVILYDEYEDVEYNGVVDRIDQAESTMRLDNAWIEFGKIIRVIDTRSFEIMEGDD